MKAPRAQKQNKNPKVKSREIIEDNSDDESDGGKSKVSKPADSEDKENVSKHDESRKKSKKEEGHKSKKKKKKDKDKEKVTVSQDEGGDDTSKKSKVSLPI